jgi:hypothetical protein
LLDGDAHRPLLEFMPVLALSVIMLDATGAVRILVGVRDPRANRTHPNVASVPTRRVAAPLAEDWRKRMRRSGLTRAEDYPGLRTEVLSILSQKLGMADSVELGRVDAQLFGLQASQGISVIGEDDLGAQITESLTMFNAGVLVSADTAKLVPGRTGSYRSLVWADVESFLSMTSTRDVGRLNAGLEKFFFCAYGLCLQTSVAMLEAAGLGSVSRS